MTGDGFRTTISTYSSDSQQIGEIDDERQELHDEIEERRVGEDHVGVEESENSSERLESRVEKETHTVEKRDERDEQAEEIGGQLDGLVDASRVSPLVLVVLGE